MKPEPLSLFRKTCVGFTATLPIILALGWIMERPEEAERFTTEAVILDAKDNRSRRGTYRSCHLTLAYSYQKLVDKLSPAQARDVKTDAEAFISFNYLGKAEARYRSQSRKHFSLKAYPYVAIRGERAKGRCSNYPVGSRLQISYNKRARKPKLVDPD